MRESRRYGGSTSIHWSRVGSEIDISRHCGGVKCVVFDLDGTLIDSLEDIAAAMNASLRFHGYDEHPASAYREFVGDGVEVLARRALPTGASDDATVAGCVAKMRAVYAKNWNVRTKPYEGINEMLAGLGRAGTALAVLSNKPHDMTVTVVEALLGDWYFERIVGARPGVPKKPDATMAIDICRSIGVRPQETLYVGDTDTDMKTAVAAGMYPVGALWGFRGRSELVRAGARTTIAHPTELLSLLG